MELKKNKIIIPILHVLAWIILFSIPYFLLALDQNQSQVFLKTIARSWVHLIIYGFIFYLNYFKLIDKYLFSEKTVFFIVINVVLISFSIFLREQLKESYFDNWFTESVKDEKFLHNKEMFFYINLIATSVPVVFAIALKTTERWVNIEKENKEIATVKLQTEIQHLKYQLQPHFFFNSLNNIYSLVDISPDQAKTTIHSLSKLMRYLLYETNTELVFLSKEIDFMKKYIDLMKLRLTDKTTVKYSFPENVNQVKIAPLMFISLIENAFKHGVSANKKSFINIDMNVFDTIVVFKIKNSNFPKHATDKSGSGIGLDNLKKGLNLLYADKHNLDIKVEGEVFSVVLEIKS
ncbi:histidine kinase [Cellulophaga baltica]|nr:histidine kinase [Cellulophaga baltica]